MAGEKIFIDTNVLVYANNTLSPLCIPARAQLQQAFASYESVWLSRQVFREFAVIVSREMHSTGKIDFQLLGKTIRRFEKDFFVAEDNPLITSKLLHLLEETNSSGKQVHDTNIVATMLVHDIQTLMTHNTEDFKRFSHLITLMPLV